MRLPKNTCPDIDKAIAAVREAIQECWTVIEEDDSTAIERANHVLSRIELSIRYVPDMLEELRSANSSLRDAAMYYEEQVSELQDKIDGLEEELRDKNEIIDDLTAYHPGDK